MSFESEGLQSIPSLGSLEFLDQGLDSDSSELDELDEVENSIVTEKQLRPTSPANSDVWSSRTPSVAGSVHSPKRGRDDGDASEALTSLDLDPVGLMQDFDDDNHAANSSVTNRSAGDAAADAMRYGVGPIGDPLRADCKPAEVWLHLDTSEWRWPPSSQESHSGEAIGLLGKISSACLRTIPVKGRKGKDEKATDRRAEEILRSSRWTITNETSFEDLESLTTVLVKYLETHLPGASQMMWCVGGSMQATLDSRDECRNSNILCFTQCSSSGWTGDGQSKVGNTCKWHAGDLTAREIYIGGEYRDVAQLKKCTWIKCCYGKKRYGDPPHIPWCSQCEFQKKLVAGPIAKEPAATKSRELDTESCDGCLVSIAKSRFGTGAFAGTPCGSCRALLTALDRLIHNLPLPLLSPLKSEPGQPQALSARPAASDFGERLKTSLVATLCRFELRDMLSQVDPILLEAMTYRYNVADINTLWDNSAEARVTLSKQIMNSIGFGQELHSQLLASAHTMMRPEQAQLLRAVHLSQFLSCWHLAVFGAGLEQL
jgi:hypothetical protein